MSLQVTAFCYICMMLAFPLTICLLVLLKKGAKAKEVKQYSLIEEANLVKDVATLTVNWEAYYSRLAILETIASLEGVDVEVDWEEYEDEEDYLEPVDNSCYECGDRSKLGVICEKCYEEKELDSRASGLSTTPSLQHEEEGLNRVTLEQMEKDVFYSDLEEEEKAYWMQDIEEALSVSRRTLLPRFKKRKTCFGKDSRKNGRKFKYEWSRK